MRLVHAGCGFAERRSPSVACGGNTDPAGRLQIVEEPLDLPRLNQRKPPAGHALIVHRPGAGPAVEERIVDRTENISL